MGSMRGQLSIQAFAWAACNPELPPLTTSPHPSPSNPAGGHSHKKRHDDDDDAKKSCKDIRDRKECRRARAVCSWCNGGFVPSMCLDEVRTLLCVWGLGRWGAGIGGLLSFA